MAIDMTTVKKIIMPGHLYKKTIYLTNSTIVYKGTSNPCPIEITLFSKTTDTPTITASNFYNVLGECGYTRASNSRYYLTVDNPYEFIYNNGTYDCVYASFQSQSTTYPIVVFFSVPGATSTSVSSGWTITEEPWFDIGYMPTYDYEYKTYLNKAAGSYTNFTVGKDEYGNEKIANYCINGSSYPEVTIVSVSGDTYTLSNQDVITTPTNYSSAFDLGKEVKKIEDGDGNVLWPKETGPEWHTLWSGSAYAEIYTTSSNSYWQSTISDTNVLATIPIEAVGSGCQLRITWLYSWGKYPSPSSRYYLKNDNIYRSTPGNPYVIDTSSLGKNTDWRLLGLVANGSSEARYQGKVYLKWNSNTRELRLATAYNSSQNIGNNYKAQFAVTKIEAYY